MHNLIRFYNQNRKRVWFTLLIIAFILLFIYWIGEFGRKGQSKSIDEPKKSLNEVDQIIQETKKSIISDTQITEEQAKENIDIIENFINYCNNGQVELAYNLLTDECKTTLYPDINAFINDYYNSTFNSKKTYSLENWITTDKYTYRVKIMDDMLSSGKVDTNKYLEDYYTVVNTENGNRLNISGLVGSTKLEVTQNLSNIEFKIETKKVYMNYEIYEIEITNNGEKSILLDTIQNTDSVYIKDRNDTTYKSFMNEIDESLLVVEQNQKRTIKIKFNKMYQTSRNICSMHFDKIILDYDEYKNTENKEEYSNVASVVLEW